MSRRNRGLAPAVPTIDRRQVLRLFGAVAAVGATGGLAACGTGLPTVESEKPSGLTIPIGLVAPSTGPYARTGADMLKGFKLYLANNKNLLGTHNVDLTVVDEGATVESAVAAGTDLMGKRMLAVAGVANPAALPALATKAQESKIPLVSSNPSPGTLTNALFVWRVSYVEGEAGRSLAQYAKAEGPRAYVMYEDSSTGKAEAEAFKTAFTDLGGNLVGEAVGAGNLSTRMNSARSANASVIFACFGGAEATAVLEAYRAANLNAKLLGTGALTETFDLAALGNPPARVYTSLFYASDLDNEANRRFVASYHSTHGVPPSAYAMAAYDSAGVLDRALHLVDGPPTGSALNQAFSLLGQIDSPRGTWTFNINRTPQQKWYLRKLHLDGTVPANLLDTDLMVLG